MNWQFRLPCFVPRVVVLAVLAALVAATPALASPTLVLTPDQGPSPTTVIAAGEGFSAMIEVTLTVGGVAAGSVMSDAAGSIKATLTITGSPGLSVEVAACQADPTGDPCGVKATSAFRIVGPATTTSTAPPSTTTSTTTTSTTTTSTTTPARTTTTTSTTVPPSSAPPVETTEATADSVPTTQPPESTDSTEAVAVVPGSEDGDSTDGSDPTDPDGGGSFAWLWLLAGAAVVGWWLLRRRGGRPATPTMEGTSDDGGVFVEPTAQPPEASGPDLFVVIPKVETSGSAAREGEVIPKLEIDPGATESKGKGKGMIDATWKVEEAEKAGRPASPELGVDSGGPPEGHVFPKVEIEGTAAQPGEVIPKLEIGPEATETKGKGMIDATWKVEEGEKAGPLFPKLDSPAGEAEGKVFPKVEIGGTAPQPGEVIPKLEIDPGPAPEAAKGGNAETTWKVEKGEKAAAVFPKLEMDGGGAAEAKEQTYLKVEMEGSAVHSGEVIPKLEVPDTGATEAKGKGGGNAETTWKVEEGEAAAPGPHAGPDGDILDHLDDEG